MENLETRGRCSAEVRARAVRLVLDHEAYGVEPIGNIPPAEAEARYYAQSEELARVA